VHYDTVIDQKDLAMIIDHCPRFVQRFLGSCTVALSKPQRCHLWRVVLAIAVSSGGAKLAHLAAMILGGRHRTRLGSFLRDADWDAPSVLREQVLATLRWMRPRRGETIELLIDDTRVAKRGRWMAALQKIWDHAHQRFVRGHIWVVAAIRFRGVVLPWRIVLWKPRRVAKRDYRKTTDIAAEIIATFELPWALKVRVLFDAFYLCPQVTKTCRNKGFVWFSVAARNRTFTRDRGRRAKLGASAPGWLRHGGRSVRMPRARGHAKMRIASVDGHLSRIGPVRLVASKRPRDPWRNLVIFATNAKMDARQIVAVYERRWDIEVMFKELRSDLGLGDYQMLDERAIVRHLHLCALAHLLLTRHAMECMAAQARKANHEVALPPMSIRRESLRTMIRRDQIRRLLGERKHRTLRSKLEPYLMAA
jgi:SRSO17 transposase